MNCFLVNYATKEYFPSQRRLNNSALKHGINKIISLNPKSICKTDFYKKNHKILSQSRGAGYWLWKPYIILDSLLKLEENDILIYLDSGTEIIRDLSPLIELCIVQGGILLFENHEKLNRQWTKRDCFILMGCDEEKYHEGAQVTATFQIYMKNRASIEFLKNYLELCCNEHILTDIPNISGIDNFPDFVDHRHDQSILSLLAIKHDVQLFRDPTQFGNYLKLPEFREENEWLSQPYSSHPCQFSKYPTLINHHRERPMSFYQRLKQLLKKTATLHT